MTTHPLTTQELQIVYQSNEPVPVTGQYMVVENKTVQRRVKQTGELHEPHQPVSRRLVVGERFPNVDGYAVVWRLLHIERE
jgi:hypothetical protein